MNTALFVSTKVSRVKLNEERREEIGCAGYTIYLIVLLLQYFATEALSVILWQLGFCSLVIGGILVADRDWRRKLRKSGWDCPSCHKWLDAAVADTGCCSHCGERVLDL